MAKDVIEVKFGVAKTASSKNIVETLKEIANKISDTDSQRPKIAVSLNVAKTRSLIKKDLDEIAKSLDFKFGNNGSGASKNSAISLINLDDETSKVNTIKNQLEALSTKTGIAIPDNIKTDLKDITAILSKVREENDGAFTSDQMKVYQTILTSLKAKFGEFRSDCSAAMAEVEKGNKVFGNASAINHALSRYSALNDQFRRLKEIDKTRVGIGFDSVDKNLSTLFKSIENAKTDNNAESILKMNAALKAASDSLSLYQSSIKTAHDSSKNVTSAIEDNTRAYRNQGNIVSQINKYLNDYSGKLDKAGLLGAFTDLRDKAQSDVEFGGSSLAREQLAQLKMAASTAGIEFENAGEKLSNLFKAHLGSSIALGAINALKQGFTEVFKSIKEVDDAMTELKKVTDETENTYRRFLDTAAQRSKSIGASLSDTITATADYARLGYNLQEASALADASLVYKNVGDGIENITDASESIISTMKAFKISAEDAMGIVDAYNKVGNEFAISSSGIGEALKRSSASLASAGNSMEQSIAMAAAMNEVVQDPEKVGTALKTVAMYIRAAKTEAEDAGISTDKMANSVSELRGEILSLTNHKVDIMVDENSFKETFEIFKEVSNVWDDLSDVSQSRLTELLGGGVRNSQSIISLIENFSTAEEAYKSALESSGSAEAENAKYMDSISGKQQQLKAGFEAYAKEVMGSDMAKRLMDIAIKFVNMAEGAEKAHLIAAPLFTFFASAKAGGIEGIIKSLKNLKSKLVEIKDSGGFKMMFDQKALTKNLQDSMTKSLESDIAILNNVKNEMFNNGKLFGEAANSAGLNNASVEAQNLAKSFDTTANSIDAASNAINEYKVKQTAAIASTQAQTAATKALAVAKNLATSAILAVGAALVSVAIRKVSEAWDKATVSVEEATDAAKAGANELKYLDDHFAKLEQIKNSTASYTEKNEELVKWKEELIKKYRLEKEAIDAINLDLENQAGLYDTLTKKAINEAIAGFQGRHGKNQYDEAVTEIENPKEWPVLTNRWNTRKYQDIKNSYEGLKNYLNTVGVKFSEIADEAGFSQIRVDFEGNAIEKLEQVEELIADLNSSGDFDKADPVNKNFLEQLTHIKNKLTEIKNEYGDLYEEGNDTYARKWIVDNFEDGINSVEQYEAAVIRAKNAKVGGKEESDIKSEGERLSILTELASMYPQYAKEVENASNANVDFNRSITDVDGSLSGYSGKLDSLRTAFVEFSNTGAVSADTIKKIGDEFDTLDTTKLKGYLDEIANAKTPEELRLAMQKLSGEYLTQSGALRTLNEETKETLTKQLELIGVKNAAALVEKELVKQQIQSKIAADDTIKGLADLDEEFIKTSANALVAAGAFKDIGDAKKYMQLQTLIASTNGLTTATVAVKDKIIELAKYFGLYDEISDKLEKIDALTQMIDDPSYFGLSEEDIAEGKDKIASLRKEIIALLQSPGAANVDVTGIQAIEQELDNLKLKLSTGEISPEEYQSKVTEIYNKQVKDNAAYVELDKKLQEELHSFTIENINKKKDALERDYSNQVITRAQYIQKFRELNEKEIKLQKDLTEEYKQNKAKIAELERESLEELYNMTEEMIKKGIEDEIEALDRKNTKRKEGIEDQKDDLEAEATAYERAKDKEIKVIEELITALDRKTKAAKQAVEDEKKALDRSVEDQIYVLNQQKDNLKESVKAEKKAAEDRYKAAKKEIEDKIKLLKKEKEEYQKLFDAQKKALEDNTDSEDFDYELGQKQANMAKLIAEQNSLRGDTSASAIKRKAELEDEIKKLNREIYEFQRDRNVDLAKDELDRLKEAMEDSYDDQIDKLEDQKDALSESYDKEKDLIESVADAQERSIERQIDALNRYKTERDRDFSDRIEKIERESEKQKQAYEDQKKRYEEDKKAFKQNIDDKKKKLEELDKEQTRLYNKEKQDLQDTLKNKEEIMRRSLHAMEGDYSTFMQSLINYNSKYGDNLVSTVIGAWNAAKDAVKNYNVAADSTGMAKAIADAVNTSLKGRLAVGTRSAPISGFYQTDEQGYEIKLNRTSGNNYEFLNSGSVVLPHNATERIMSFISDPTNYIRRAMGNMIPNGVGQLTNTINAPSYNTPVSINNEYHITGDNPQAIAKEIEKTAQSCVDKAFDKLNSTLRRNGIGRKAIQLA